MKELDDGEGEALVVRHDEGGSDLSAQCHPAGKHQLTTVITCRPTEQEYSCFRYANTKFASVSNRQCDWISSATEAENEFKITSASHL